MKDILFDTQQKRDEAVVNFRSLLIHPGWLLIKAIIDANIQNLRSQLDDPDSGDNLEEIHMKQRLMRFYVKTFNMPEEKIKDFSGNAEGVDPDLDPFEKPPKKEEKS